MPVNRHGTLLILHETGVLITGESGSGKTSLALALLAHCTVHGRFARLVADDQLFLAERNGRLIGRAPAAIGGLAEARGLGPVSIAHEPAAVVDLVVRLVPGDAVPRFQEPGTTVLEGVRLACLDVAEHGVAAALMAVAARLSLPPFG